MKTRAIARTCLPVIFALLLTVTTVGAGEKGRIPPGVQKYPAKGNVENTSPDMLTVFTNDNSQKVSDFYRKGLNMDPVEAGRFLVGTDATYKDKIGHTDSPLWLSIYPAGTVLDDKDLFGFLQQEIIVKRMHSDKELEQVKQRYAHLGEAWYPDIDAEQKLRSCSEAIRGNVTASRNREPRRNKEQEKEMMAEMQRLMAQGRHKEAAELARKSARPGMDTAKAMQQDNMTDHWDEWIACLEELDRHDFRTKIEIDLYSRYFKPSTNAERNNGSGQSTEREREKQDRQNKREAEKGRDVNEQMNRLKKMYKF